MGTLADTLRQVGSSPAATTFGTVLSAGGQVGSGIAARRSADFAANEADVAAGPQQAAAQRSAYDVTRRGTLLASRAQAVAAASGGTATDPTVTDIIGKIAGNTAYRSQLALYQGDEAARALQTRADVSRFEGQQSQTAGYLKAFGTVLKGGTTLMDKLGGRPKTVLGSSDFGGVDSYYDDAGWGMT